MEIIIRFQKGYRFFSNFWLAEIEYEGIRYPSTEHGYQAAKTIDVKEKKYIADLKKCGEAKRAGRNVNIRPDWNEVKDKIMLDLVRIKFSTHKDLADKLLDTKDAILVEGNHWCDNHFGVCYCEKCNGIGDNILGQVLMQVGEELKKDKQLEIELEKI